MNRPRHVEALTALRAIAAWLVVLYHFREVMPDTGHPVFGKIVDHGYLAVDLFFMMSGFVISLNYGKTFNAFNKANYINFILLRVARIYPLHIFIMFFYLTNPIAILLFSDKKNLGPRYDLVYYPLSLLLVQNWGFTDNIAWNVPAWSISTEFFVYLIFPLLWIAASALAQRRLLLIGVALTLIATFMIGYFLSGGLGNYIARFGLIRCLIEFSLGMLLFRLAGETPLLSSNQALATLIAVAAAGLVSGFPDYAVAPLAFMLLIMAVLDPAGIGAKLLNIQLLVWLGEISYSTYLAHYLVRDWIKFTLVRPDVNPSLAFAAYLAIVFAVSPILYYAIEQPGRRLLRSKTPQQLLCNLPLQRQIP